MINTSAPTITPPEGSMTMPLTLPFGDCARAVCMNRTRTMKYKAVSFTRTRHLLGANSTQSLFMFSQEWPQLYHRASWNYQNNPRSGGTAFSTDDLGLLLG